MSSDKKASLIIPDQPETKDKEVAVEDTVGIDGINWCLYTDGGSRPSRGIGGWGVHGYGYVDGKPKQGAGAAGVTLTNTGYRTKPEMVDANPEIVKTVTQLHYLDGCGSLIPETTNNIAEMEAVIKAMEFALEHKAKTLSLLMDSDYVLKTIYKPSNNIYTPDEPDKPNRLTGWIKNNWLSSSNEPVKNKPHWVKINSLLVALERAEIKLYLFKVVGHSGNLGNDNADQLATRGIIAGRKQYQLSEMKVTDAKGYWSTKLEFNRFFSFKNWYFNTNYKIPTTADGRFIYHLGAHGKEDDFLMKPISDASFGVVYSKPEPLLEKIREYQNDLDNTNCSSVVICNLPNLFKKSVADDIMDYGNVFLQSNTEGFGVTGDAKIMARGTKPMQVKPMNISDADDNPLTIDLRPALLAIRTFDKLAMLENILDNFLDDPVKHKIAVTDITSILYEAATTGKKTVNKVSKELAPGVNSIKVDVKHIVTGEELTAPLTLTVGIDLPSRNAFSAIADQTPKVSVVTWMESKTAFRYATIIQAGSTDGIWGAIFSNIHLL